MVDTGKNTAAETIEGWRRVRDYYYCKTCKRRFFKVETALEHKIATGHRIYHRFADWPEREAFANGRGEQAR